MNAVEAKELYKRYDKVWALNGLTVSIPTGRVVCILGPNGAGKTTFLHIISTILKPSSGSVKVMGYDVIKQGAQVRKVLGISFQEPKLFWRFSPEEVLKLHARVHGIRDMGAVEGALRQLGLWEIRRRSVEFLSGGERKKVEIAKVLIQKPRLAIFDEPTAMIDLEGKHYIWDTIKSLAASGSTVLVATNEMYEAEVLAESILLINKGRLVTMAKPRELKEMVAGGDLIELLLSAPPSMNTLERIRRFVTSEVDLQGSRLMIRVRRYWTDLPPIIEMLRDEGLVVLEVKVKEPSLDEVITRVTS
jgi:ABC-2 type transport system ATP-binding protein